MGMENQIPKKKLIDDNGVLLRTPGMIRHEQEEEARKNAVEATGENAGGLLDRSKMAEARKTRLEGEIAEAAEKPKEGVLDRTLMRKQQKEADNARAQELKKTIEERLTAVKEKVGVDETDGPFSKEGLLNRNFGK